MVGVQRPWGLLPSNFGGDIINTPVKSRKLLGRILNPEMGL